MAMDIRWNHKEIQGATICVMDIIPNDGRKSCYGKAQMIHTDYGRYLRSYDTIVLVITNDLHVIKLWDGYSATTMRHINYFFASFGIHLGGKKLWDKMEPHKPYSLAKLTEMHYGID